MKKPWLAAALNLGLPGLGYVYVGHRLVLGVGLIILAVFAITSLNSSVRKQFLFFFRAEGLQH